MENQLTIKELEKEKFEVATFGNSNNFEHSQRVAKMLASSSLIPKEYQGNIQNTMIALEMSNRIGASPLMVMQNLYIIHGKPSWSSSFIIAAINATKKFTPLRFLITGEGKALSCIAWALENGTNERLESPKVTMEMAEAEGWVNKNGSKWKTMPDLMIRYRAATFFGRLYAPEVLMGMMSSDEVVDITHEIITPQKLDEAKENERIVDYINTAKSIEELEAVEVHLDRENSAQMTIFSTKKKELNTVEA